MRTMLSKLFLVFVISLALIATFFNGAIEAQEAEKTDKVITTGLGLDRDKAKENAIRNAVEYAVGIYV